MCHRWFTGRATKQAGTELWARGLPAGAFEGAIASPVYAVCRANSSTCSHSMSHGARDGAHRRIHLRNQVASRGLAFLPKLPPSSGAALPRAPALSSDTALPGAFQRPAFFLCFHLHLKELPSHRTCFQISNSDSFLFLNL